MLEIWGCSLTSRATWTRTGEQGWRSGESTDVPLVRFWARTICGLSLLLVLSLLREVFPQVLRFSPFLENQHFQIPIRPGMLERLIHEPLAREIGQPLPALSSLNNLNLSLNNLNLNHVKRVWFRIKKIYYCNHFNLQIILTYNIYTPTDQHFCTGAENQ